MKRNLATSLLLSIILSSIQLQAQSYEGNMSGVIAQKDVNLFIWVDLLVPNDNSIVTGSYFYKTIGKKISVSGKKEGQHITLFEKDKNQKTTGVFSLKMVDNNLVGYWYKPNSKDTLQVVLYKTNPEFRNTAKIPTIKKLLAEDIAFYADGLDSNAIDEAITYSVIFARYNILCVELHWENYMYTAHYGTLQYTFDLSNGESVNLKEAINDSCMKYLCDTLQRIVDVEHAAYSDSEWVAELYPFADSTEFNEYLEKIRDIFIVDPELIKAALYLDNEGLTCFIEDYLEQYYTAGNRGATFNCTVTIPFKDLKAFIKPDSILKNIFTSQ